MSGASAAEAGAKGKAANKPAEAGVNGKAANKPVDKPKPKRGPGRPPKKQAAPPLEKVGIVDSPTSAENRLEFVYEDPMILKSVFTYFKSMKAVNIHVRCAPDGITFFTRNNSHTSRIVAEIPGASVNHYYCEGTFWLGLNRENVMHVFSSIDKSYFKVTIVHRHDDPDGLGIIYKDAEIDKESNFRVPVTSPDADQELFDAEKITRMPNAFPIEFTLTAKQFKKTVTDAGHFSESLSFEKMGEYPLQITYSRLELTYNEVYRSPEKIGLRSAVKPDENFICTVAIDNIKHLATSMVTDTVQIYCREGGDIMFRSEIDVLVMSTLTCLS